MEVFHIGLRGNDRDFTAYCFNSVRFFSVCAGLFCENRYSPDSRWRIETLITMLTIAGGHCDEVSGPRFPHWSLLVFFFLLLLGLMGQLLRVFFVVKTIGFGCSGERISLRWQSIPLH